MTPSESNHEPTLRPPGADGKSPIVNRRRALAMAFRQAVASLGDARSKAGSGILDVVAQVKKAAETPPPRE